MTTQTETNQIDGHGATLVPHAPDPTLEDPRFGAWMKSLTAQGEGVFPVGVSGICPGTDEMATAYLRDDIDHAYGTVIRLRHELRDLMVSADADPGKSERERANRWAGIYRVLFHPRNTYASKIESAMITIGCSIPVLEEGALARDTLEEDVREWLDAFLPQMDKLAEAQLEPVVNEHVDGIDVEKAYAAVADVRAQTIYALRRVYQLNSSVSAWKLLYEAIHRTGLHSWATALRGPLNVIGVEFPHYVDPKASYWQDARAWLTVFLPLADELAGLRATDTRLIKTSGAMQ